MAPKPTSSSSPREEVPLSLPKVKDLLFDFKGTAGPGGDASKYNDLRHKIFLMVSTQRMEEKVRILVGDTPLPRGEDPPQLSPNDQIKATEIRNFIESHLSDHALNIAKTVVPATLTSVIRALDKQFASQTKLDRGLAMKELFLTEQKKGVLGSVHLTENEALIREKLKNHVTVEDLRFGSALVTLRPQYAQKVSDLLVAKPNAPFSDVQATVADLDKSVDRTEEDAHVRTASTSEISAAKINSMMQKMESRLMSRFENSLAAYTDKQTSTSSSSRNPPTAENDENSVRPNAPNSWVWKPFHKQKSGKGGKGGKGKKKGKFVKEKEKKEKEDFSKKN